MCDEFFEVFVGVIAAVASVVAVGWIFQERRGGAGASDGVKFWVLWAFETPAVVPIEL